MKRSGTQNILVLKYVSGVQTMLKTSLLFGVACAIALTGPAMAQLYPWSGGVGGAIGGYNILGTTPSDNAPLLALNLDRMAHVSGNYANAIVQFDRVIRPDGSAVLMRRVSDPNNPNVFGYLPKSWPGVGTKGIERVHGADGSVISTQEVIIPESEVRSQPIPMDGPRVGTLVVQRDIMSNGSVQIAESVRAPEPAVAVTLNEAMERGTNLAGQTFKVASG